MNAVDISFLHVYTTGVWSQGSDSGNEMFKCHCLNDKFCTSDF